VSVRTLPGVHRRRALPARALYLIATRYITDSLPEASEPVSVLVFVSVLGKRGACQDIGDTLMPRHR
jgi:hypothetical protein